MSHRLPAPWGRQINREQVLNFSFEGRPYQGFEGDTLASALAANGVLRLSRSFKYHRPRGAFTYSGMDANSYVQVGDQPNVLADQLAIYEGLQAGAQNVWGSLANDRGAITGMFSRFLPPGFYYRAFFRPRGIWPWWEKLIRRSAGLGRVDTQARHAPHDKQYLFADVAVIGGGPAGMRAALSAAGAGASVILADDGACLGGSLSYARFQRDPAETERLRQELLSAIDSASNIRVLDRTTCTGWFNDNWLALHRDRRLFKLRARQVIAACGSIEQPMVFRNNDLPGVLPASALQRLLRMYGVLPGKRIAIVTHNTEGYDLALDLLEAGQPPVVLLDLNPESVDPDTGSVLREHGVEALSGRTIVEAQGNQSLTGIVSRQLDASGIPSGNEQRFAVDALVTSIGYAPLAQLVCQAGGRLQYDSGVHSLRLSHCPPAAYLAGSVNHAWSLDCVLQQGEAAGLAAASAAGFGKPGNSAVEADPCAEKINHPMPVFSHEKGKEFVDFDEDQTIGDLRKSVADGFDHPELAKRYSTTGMGPSQGRLSSLNALRIVQAINGGEVHGSDITTQRPPFKPLSIGLLAGRNFAPERLTPMHQWHLDHGAHMMPAGLWQRPAYYGQAQSREEAISKEVLAVRSGVGLIDVSTLGGIEIRGPDAPEFLNRAYTFAYTKQAVGSTRYLLMCDDTGTIVDDGVAYRRAEDHFYLTTTTTGSEAVCRSMLKHAAEWGLDISIANLTTAWAAMSLAGPDARKVVESLDSDIDFSSEAFPYLAGRSGQLNSANAMALRVGFVGELGFELHVPWSRALKVWQAVISVGQEFNIRPVGVEAQRILRLEKGHLIVGQDTDGLTFPHEAGLDWALSTTKEYFTGGPAIRFLQENGVARQLVGFKLTGDSAALPQECNLVLDGETISGRVTSVARSDALQAVIGLAYVRAGQGAVGTDISIKLSDGGRVSARVVDLPFYDSEKLRQAL